MQSQRKLIAQLVPDGDKSKAFLFGLYLGLSLMLFVSWFVRNPDAGIHRATNIYGLQAIAGAFLGFWRVWKGADDRRKLPAVASLWICFGLAAWAIGQAVWVWKPIYPGPADVLYLISDIFWLVALVTIFRSLDRRCLPAIGAFTKVLIPIAASLITSWLVSGRPTVVSGSLSLKIVDNFSFLLVSFTSLMLAIGLVLGENSEIPLPLHQCIRYLCAATAIEVLAILAFTITDDLQSPAWAVYHDGNWVDWLFLTAMYCWGVSALKWPIRPELFEYTLHTKRTLRLEDVYRASDVAQAHSPAQPLTQSESITWILDNIPGCWKVVKLGNLIVGSTFLFPVPRHLINRFLRQSRVSDHQTIDQNMIEEVKRKERQMFEEVKKDPPTWECLYLADASILTKHRRRGLAFRSYRSTIDDIARQNAEAKIEVYCWPVTLAQEKLADKLREYFKNQIRVNKIQ